MSIAIPPFVDPCACGYMTMACVAIRRTVVQPLHVYPLIYSNAHRICQWASLGCNTLRRTPLASLTASTSSCSAGAQSHVNRPVIAVRVIPRLSQHGELVLLFGDQAHKAAPTERLLEGGEEAEGEGTVPCVARVWMDKSIDLIESWRVVLCRFGCEASAWLTAAVRAHSAR